MAMLFARRSNNTLRAQCLTKLQCTTSDFAVAVRSFANSEEQGSSSADNQRPAHWTEAPTSDKHWLDRRLPGAREWLESKNREFWIRGIQGRCSLDGREEFVREQLERTYQSFLEKHSHLAQDERSQTHLQVGCLMLATDRVLTPWVRNTEAVRDIIRAHMGESASPVLRFLLRYVLYLSLDPFTSTVRRLRGLRLDYGRSFEAEVSAGERDAKLQIRSCFYHRLFAEENSQHLLECCCCSQDKIWFENLHAHGLGFNRRQWLAAGDSQCCLVVSKLEKRT